MTSGDCGQHGPLTLVSSVEDHALLDRLYQAEKESLESRLALAREALQEILSYHARHYGLAFKAGHMAEIAGEALAKLEEYK